MKVRVLSLRRSALRQVAVARVEAVSASVLEGSRVASFKGTVRVRAACGASDREVRDLARDQALRFLDVD